MFYFRGSDICLLVYSVDDEQSFYNLDIWKREFLYYADIKDPDSFPFVLLGNKCDLDEGTHEVKTADVKNWCEVNGNMKFFKTSAKDSVNVEAAFQASVQTLIESEMKMDKKLKASPSYTTQVNLNHGQNRNNENNKSSCCS